MDAKWTLLGQDGTGFWAVLEEAQRDMCSSGHGYIIAREFVYIKVTHDLVTVQTCWCHLHLHSPKRADVFYPHPPALWKLEAKPPDPLPEWYSAPGLPPLNSTESEQFLVEARVLRRNGPSRPCARMGAARH